MLRTNLMNPDAARLDRAARDGLLKELFPQVELVTNDQASPNLKGPFLTTNMVRDGGFAYLRPAMVEAGLAREMETAMSAMKTTNKIKGWILDLRGAGGSDYRAAVAIADRFVATEQDLLDFGEGMARSKAKANTNQLPLTVLLNHATAAAAEALAAMLSKAEAGLLLGTNTAGQAFIWKEFPLTNGLRLRIATGRLKLGDGTPLPLQGVKPDIRIVISPEDERAYLEDPYRVLAKASVSGFNWGQDTNLTASGTNKHARHRINEADLVRFLREGQDYSEEGHPAFSADPARPVLRDPALARAVDLLKGLALLRRSR